MPKHAHLLAGALALLCIAMFFLATILTELFDSHAAVAHGNPVQAASVRQRTDDGNRACLRYGLPVKAMAMAATARTARPAAASRRQGSQQP